MGFSINANRSAIDTNLHSNARNKGVNDSVGNFSSALLLMMLPDLV